MKTGVNYRQYNLIGYEGYYYLFENGICLNAKKNVILIPQNEEIKTQNKNVNITDNIKDTIKDNINENINKSSGLINSGHSCFINAILQCLVNCTPLTNYFLTNYKKKSYNTFSNIYQDFIIRYQQKDLNAANDIVDYFFSCDSSIKQTGSDSKDVLLEYFDKIQSELKSSEESIIMEVSTNPENEREVIKERIKVDKENYSIINECFNFWIESEQKCNYVYCSKYCKSLYEIRPEIYFEFYLSEIYNKRYSYYSSSVSKKRYGNNKLSLEECFYYYLIEKGACSYCQSPIDIKNKICKLPNILIIVLNRGINNQYNINIDLSQELHLEQFYQKLKYHNSGLNNEICPIYNPIYNLLCGTILEKDYKNPGKGHTIAFATDNKGKYTVYNDSKILYNIDFENIKNKDVYILFYQMKKNNNSSINNTSTYKKK